LGLLILILKGGTLVNKWREIPVDEEEESYKLIQKFARKKQIHPLIAKKLYHDGLKTEKDFMDFLLPTIDQLHDPYLLNDMKKAVSRIVDAIKNKEKILLCGNPSADGITATSILYKTLNEVEADVIYKVPKSLGEQYITKVEVSLIIVVGNGIHDQDVRISQEFGNDLIFIDYHEVSKSNLTCYAHINPLRKDSEYPYKFLSGTGVTLKLVHALYNALCLPWEEQKVKHMPLAAIGTIAASMPLTQENRVICYYGLKALNKETPLAIKFLTERFNTEIDSTAIAKQIIPKLNSLCIVEETNKAVEMLLGSLVTDQLEEVFNKAFNKYKSSLSIQSLQAEHFLSEHDLEKYPILVAKGPFSEDMIGAISAKLAEKYNKPTVIISENGNGAIRAFNAPSFSVFQALKHCSNDLSYFSGHQTAGTFAVNPSQVKSYFRSLQNFAWDSQIPFACFYTGNLPLKDITHDIFQNMRYLEPCGIGNPKPVFQSSFSSVPQLELFGEADVHAKISCSRENQTRIEAHGYFKGEVMRRIHKAPFGILYSPLCPESQTVVIERIREQI